MTLDCADVIPQAIWAEACSMAIYIKNRLPHSPFKFQKSPYKILYSDKPSIKYLYPFGAKYYVQVPEEKQIGTSKLSPSGMKYYVVGYTESSKIFRLYDPHKHQAFTFKDVIFPDSTKCLVSIKIESPANLPFDLNNDAP
jgi:hypothetical protein